MVLLDDERISNIAVGENQEELASLKGIHKDILVDESRSQIMNQSDFFCHALSWGNEVGFSLSANKANAKPLATR